MRARALALDFIRLRLNDTATLVVVLDILGLGVVGSAVHQSELNRIWEARRGPDAGRP